MHTKKAKTLFVCSCPLHKKSKGETSEANSKKSMSQAIIKKGGFLLLSGVQSFSVGPSTRFPQRATKK